MPFVKSYQVSDGAIAGEHVATELEDLYATPDELSAMFGVCVSEGQIRHAMGLINGYCHRQTLWPADYEFPSIRLPADRMETRLPITPVIRVKEAAGRYVYGFRRDRQSFNSTYYGMGALVAMGGPVPQLVDIPPDLIQVEPSTGIIALPLGTFLLPYTEIRILALCGYIVIPFGVKVCVAQIINNVTMKGSGDRVAYGIGRINRRYATASFITLDEERLLQPYVVTAMY